MYIRRLENKIADSAAYRYIFGALFALIEITKISLKAFFNHLIEIFIAAAFILYIITAQAFDNGEIDGVTALLVIAVFVILAMALIKIKIIEIGGKKDDVL